MFNKQLLWAAGAALALLLGDFSGGAANIVWVGDYNDVAGAANDTFSAFTPAGGNAITDSGFVRLLESAGHKVIRYNSPGAAAALMSAADLTALNTNDLIIMGRAGNSPQHQAPKGLQWNTNIVKPLICMSPYFVRPDGGRLGWFTGGTLPDNTPTVLSAGDPNLVGTDYLFGGVAMNGTKTAFNFDELMDRNTSLIQEAPVVGAIVHATATFLREDTAAETTAYVIVGFPAGTVVAAGRDVLAGYRMFLGGGSREGAVFPNAIPLYTGRENLTPTGEDIFLRAVQLALNNGVPPAVDPSAPPSIASQPANATVLEGRAVAFSVTVAGAAPRTVQWQRDIGDGITFNDIPDVTTAFSISRLSLPAVSAGDNNAKFRVVVTNPNGTVTSDVVTLTVTPDTASPVPFAAASLDGNTITVYFDEVIDPLAAEFPFSYNLTSTSGAGISEAKLRADRRSVDLVLNGPVSPTFSLNVTEVTDLFLNSIQPPGVDLAGMNLGLSTADVGALNPTAGSAAIDPGTFEVSGGGLDIQAAAEQMRFAYRSVDGDFDARIRVRSITATNRLESLAKALLSARASTDGAAPSVNAFVTTPYPGDSSFGSSARTAAGALTSSNFLTVAYSPGATPATFPAWLRIKRAGNVFTTYGGANGTDWTQIGSITVAMGPTALVGAGVNSHRNGQVATATFSDFQVLTAVNAPTLINSAYTTGTFSASFQSQNGIAYRVQYKDDLNAANWTDLTTITGDGSVKSFSDTAGANRFYRVITP